MQNSTLTPKSYAPSTAKFAAKSAANSDTNINASSNSLSDAPSQGASRALSHILSGAHGRTYSQQGFINNPARPLGMAAFFVALFLYAFMSSPTPDYIGVIEIIIMAMLGLSCLCGLSLAANFASHWRGIWGAMALYGLCVPTLLGAIHGAHITDLLRDMVAFGALWLPLALSPIFSPRPYVFLWALVAAGLCMAFRYIASPEFIWASLALGVGDVRFLYLANSPLVMLAAIWLLLRGSFFEPSKILSALFVAVSLLPITTMLAMSQRATLALLVLAWGAGLVICAFKHPKRAIFAALVAVFFMALGWGIIQAGGQSLINKTLNLGTNARLDEWRMVLDNISQNPVTAMFGAGWGSMLLSPAVGEIWVRFVHGFTLATLWKMGWAGLALTAAAFMALALCALKCAKNQGMWLYMTALMLASLAPMFLYGSYKSLCFGLILTGIALPTLLDNAPTNANHDQA